MIEATNKCNSEKIKMNKALNLKLKKATAYIIHSMEKCRLRSRSTITKLR